jgi:hypothetical protein
LEVNINIIKKLTINIKDKYKYNDIELYYIQEKLEKKYSKKIIYNNINIYYLEKIEKKHFSFLFEIINMYKIKFKFSDEIEYNETEQKIFCTITNKESYDLFLKLKEDINKIKKFNTNQLFEYIENKKELKTIEEQFNSIDISDLKDDFLYI